MRTTHDAVHSIEGTILHESQKAIQFNLETVSGTTLDEAKTEWFPLSQITKIVRNPHGLDELVVSEWILKKKELI